MSGPIFPGGPAELETRLASMASPVRLVFFTQTFGCDTCLLARQAVDQIASLSDQISVVEHNLVLDKDDVATYRVDRAPAVAVVGSSDLGIRYYGVPSGYELAPLVEAVALAGGETPELGARTVAWLDGLDRPMDIKVFVTPTCAFCPQAVSLAYRLAAASPHVTASVYEATEFPDLARRYRVSGVPKIVVDERLELLGAQSEEELVAAVLAPESEPSS